MTLMLTAIFILLVLSLSFELRLAIKLVFISFRANHPPENKKRFIPVDAKKVANNNLPPLLLCVSPLILVWDFFLVVYLFILKEMCVLLVGYFPEFVVDECQSGRQSPGAFVVGKVDIVPPLTQRYELSRESSSQLSLTTGFLFVSPVSRSTLKDESFFFFFFFL